MQEVRPNNTLNIAIETFINTWDGTIIGAEVKNMYENGSSYEQICDKMEIEYEDYMEE